jgi:hypothetical protein
LPLRQGPSLAALGERRSVDHGTRVAYQYHGCRCPPRVAAEAVSRSGGCNTATATAHLWSVRANTPAGRAALIAVPARIAVVRRSVADAR